MPDVFILYDWQDQQITWFLRDHLVYEGLKLYSAPLHLAPGNRDDGRLLYSLQNSILVLVLASSRACARPIANTDIARFLKQAPNLLIAVWGIQWERLPTWIDSDLALDYTNGSMAEMQRKIYQIADRNRMDRQFACMVAGAVAFALFSQPPLDNRKPK